ncbi:DUF4168 domain-containing protein [Croceicoccus bisphenolivorans]|uniref:DUF4168 domain-containing protein n=1 Tax=Croceicoccus bisphenolivorans TaxID=1783232 RepID=UPI000835591D|nr:DUF4168 domain-containing protein [Croceicoccus bisphenolivorans]
MKKFLTAATLAGTLAATPAFAQAEAAAPAAEAPAAAPAAEAAPEAAAPITDAELDQFAGAAIKVNEIAQDATLDAEGKQAAMVTAVQASGLDAVRFNEIASKSQSDETLKGRLAEAFARRPAPEATATAAAEGETATDEQAGG